MPDTGCGKGVIIISEVNRVARQSMSNAELPVTVYRPNMRHGMGWFVTWAVMFKNVYRARQLVWQLFKRDFFAAYKKSFVGVAWIVVTPIVGILSWIFLQKTGMLRPGDVGIPYPAYVLVGTTMWGLFMGLYKAAAGTLDAGRELVMQVNFPHEAMLFKQVAQQLANFTIAFVLNIVVLVFFKVIPSWGIALLPLVALPLFFLAAALGLIISMVGVVAMDISAVAGMGIGLLMYVTPVIYSDQIANRFVQTAIRWNPLTYLVCSCRDIVIYGDLYHPQGYFIAAAISFIVFMASWRLFYVSEGKLIERMI